MPSAYPSSALQPTAGTDERAAAGNADALGEKRCAPARWALLVNPLSFDLGRRRRGTAVQLQRRAQAAGVTAMAVENAEDIRGALERLIRDGIGLIAIAGGDGTIQAAVTHVSEMPAPSRPALMLLGGGRTNLTARDLDTPRSPVRAFTRALEAGGPPPRSERRHALRLSQPGMAPAYGFFLAGVEVDRLIRDCHRYRAEKPGAWREGALSTSWFLLRTLARVPFGQYRGCERMLTIDAGELGRLSAPTSLLAVTTLRHQRGLLNPYAERGHGALRLTAVRGGAAGVWHRVPRLILGRYGAWLDLANGYLSGRCARIRIDGLSQATLDGQPLELDPAAPLEITAGPELRFSQP